MNHELAKTLTIALVQFIDREIPEGTMCCSSAECERIESSFKLGDFPSIEQFVQKKLSRLTEFEQEVSDIVEYCKEHGKNVAFDYAKRHANTLLSLARRELLSYTNESNPAIEAMADLERAVTCGNVDNIPRWLQEELNKAFKKGQELSHEDYLRGYNNGYEQAEKDLALSIDDIEKIHTFLYAIKNNKQGAFTFTRLSDEQYKEVLRRLKAVKEEGL